VSDGKGNQRRSIGVANDLILIHLSHLSHLSPLIPLVLAVVLFKLVIVRAFGPSSGRASTRRSVSARGGNRLAGGLELMSRSTVGHASVNARVTSASRVEVKSDDNISASGFGRGRQMRPEGKEIETHLRLLETENFRPHLGYSHAKGFSPVWLYVWI
jgi:hypothetical protein